MKKTAFFIFALSFLIGFSLWPGSKENKIVLYSYSEELIEKKQDQYHKKSLIQINRLQKKLKAKLEKTWTVIEVIENENITDSMSDSDINKILKFHSAKWMIFPTFRYLFDIRKESFEKLVLFDSKSSGSEKEIVELGFTGANEIDENNLLDNFTIALSSFDSGLYPQIESGNGIRPSQRVAILGFKKFNTFHKDYIAYNKSLSDWFAGASNGQIQSLSLPYLYPPAQEELFPLYCKKLNSDYLIYGTLIEDENEKVIYLNLYSQKKKMRFFLGEFKQESFSEIIKNIQLSFYNSVLYLISADNNFFLHQSKDFFFSKEYSLPAIDGSIPSIPYSLAIGKGSELFSAAWFAVIKINSESSHKEIITRLDEKKKNSYKIRRDGESNLYVMDNLNKEILFLNMQGESKGSISIAHLSLQDFQVSSSGVLFIPDSAFRSILLYHREKGWFKTIDLSSNLSCLTAIGNQLAAFVFIKNDYHLFLYNDKGELLQERAISLNPSFFNAPNVFTMDKSGGLYLLDGYGKMLVKINPENRIEWVISGASGSLKPFFNSPMDLEITPDGKKLFIADTMNYRILEYTLEGSIKTRLSVEKLFHMALLHKIQKKTDAYRIYLNLSIASNPEFTDALLEKGNLALSEKSYLDSQNYFNRILEKNKNHPQAQEGLKKAQFEAFLETARQFEFKFDRALKETGPETAKKEYEISIENFEKALKLYPKDVQALAAYALLKEKYQKSAGTFELPKLEVVSLELSDVFASLYKYYTENPAGRIRVKNSTGKTIDKIWAETEVKDFMDYASESRIYRSFLDGEIKDIPLFAVFNNKILNITEDTPIHARVKIKYIIDKKEYESAMQKPFTLYNRNAMIWDNPSKLASFITSKDTAVKNFARTVAQMFRYSRVNFLDKNFQYGIQIFDTLGIYGLSYVKDPKTPFTAYSKSRSQVDYIQYPRDVLKYKTGDCDDLSVTVSALLENIGIETAMVLVPEHIFMMFNTGLPESKRGDLTTREDLLVSRNGTLWIPLETTLVGKPFMEAWEKGAEKYKKYDQEKQLIVIETKEAWQNFAPVTLKDNDWEPVLPSKDMIERLFFQDLNQLIEQELNKKLAHWDKKLKQNPNSAEINNKIGVVYARYGKYNEAVAFFEKAASLKKNYFSPYNNMGNIFLLQKNYEKALSSYLKSEELNPNDAYLKINLAIIYKNLGKDDKVNEKYKKAVALLPSLEKEYAYLIAKETTRAKDDQQADYFIWTE